MGELTQAFKEWSNALREYYNFKVDKRISEAEKVKEEKLTPAFDSMLGASITDQTDENTLKKIEELETVL